MKNGLCPKCGSHDIYWKHEGIKSEVGGRVFVSVSFWRAAGIDEYICTNCGYLESYIPDGTDLTEIAEKWNRVKP